MASIPYNEIVQRLEKLEPTEVWMLLAELQSRVKLQPKRSIEDFAPTGKLVKNRKDWVGEMRKEWDES